MNPSELKNLDYDFDLVALADGDGTHTVLVVPTAWFEANNVDDPQDVYDNSDVNIALYDKLMAFPELDQFYSVLTY